MEKLKPDPQLSLFKSGYPLLDNHINSVIPPTGIESRKQSGDDLKAQGMKQAQDNANAKFYQWSDLAYEFLESYIKDHEFFMTEDIRTASKNIVTDPPSKRAWGPIVIKAAKNGLIEKAGYRNVMNPKAHSTPAMLWKSKKLL